MRARWLSTVFSLRNSVAAIERLVLPVATCSATSRSRALSEASPLPGAERPGRATRRPTRRRARAAASASRRAPQATRLAWARWSSSMPRARAPCATNATPLSARARAEQRVAGAFGGLCGRGSRRGGGSGVAPGQRDTSARAACRRGQLREPAGGGAPLRACCALGGRRAVAAVELDGDEQVPPAPGAEIEQRRCRLALEPGELDGRARGGAGGPPRRGGGG